MRFVFIIEMLTLENLEVTVALDADVLRNVGMEQRRLLHQSPILGQEILRQARTGFRRQAQRRVGPFTVNVEGLLWGLSHKTPDIGWRPLTAIEFGF